MPDTPPSARPASSGAALPEIARLKALAEKATPGPWCTDERFRSTVYCDDDLGSAVADCELRFAFSISPEQKIANAAYIAACSPDAILALCQAVEAMSLAARNVLLAFHDWPHHDSHTARTERHDALNALADAIPVLPPEPADAE